MLNKMQNFTIYHVILNMKSLSRNNLHLEGLKNSSE